MGKITDDIVKELKKVPDIVKELKKVPTDTLSPEKKVRLANILKEAEKGEYDKTTSTKEFPISELRAQLLCLGEETPLLKQIERGDYSG